MSESAEFEERWLTSSKSTQLYTRTYTPHETKAAVVFIHGFCEHIGRYSHVFPSYAAAGISVFAYDQRGFGRSALEVPGASGRAGYARTSWPEQLKDIEWAVRFVKEENPGVPVFLMGHSMGGALALGFATQKTNEAVGLLAGVVATGPLIELTHPAPRAQRWIGGKLSVVLPGASVSAPVNADDLSHDPAFNEAYKKDPLIKGQGTLRGIADMLGGGEQLLQKNYQNWPKDLPVLLIHGTEDKVTSFKSTEAFFNKLTVEDKKLSLYPGGYHELQNEPDGVKEKLGEEIISWIHGHLTRVQVKAGEEEVASKL